MLIRQRLAGGRVSDRQTSGNNGCCKRPLKMSLTAILHNQESTNFRASGHAHDDPHDMDPSDSARLVGRYLSLNPFETIARYVDFKFHQLDLLLVSVADRRAGLAYLAAAGNGLAAALVSAICTQCINAGCQVKDVRTDTLWLRNSVAACLLITAPFGHMDFPHPPAPVPHPPAPVPHPIHRASPLSSSCLLLSPCGSVTSSRTPWAPL